MEEISILSRRGRLVAGYALRIFQRQATSCGQPGEALRRFRLFGQLDEAPSPHSFLASVIGCMAIFHIFSDGDEVGLALNDSSNLAKSRSASPTSLVLLFDCPQRLQCGLLRFGQAFHAGDVHALVGPVGS
jgi:hypothetical protein